MNTKDVHDIDDIKWSEKSINDLELVFGTDKSRGLESENYKRARAHYGANIIKSKILEKQNFYGIEKKRDNFKIIISQAISIFGVIYILLTAALKIMGEDINIYAIIPFWAFSIIATLILCFHSGKKQAYLYRLARPKALVVRGGKKKRVFIESIVPGDVLILSTGDIVPADARLIVANSLSCIEIAGEDKTAHIRKTDNILNLPPVSLADDENIVIANSNIVFATDIIVSGSGLAIVIATGSRTRIIKSFGSSEAEYTGYVESDKENPDESELSILQKDASSITRKFSLISISFAMALLIIGIISQRDLGESLLISFTVVASMFADKLPVIADFAMAQGMRALSLRGILIKKASAVDTLNRVDTLIAKKNETFMRDILKAQKIYCDFRDYDIEQKNVMKIGQMLSYMALCVNVGNARTKKGNIIYTGTAVDVAVVKAFLKCGLNFAGLDEVYQKLEKIAYNPYSGSRSSLVYLKSQNRFILICFGEAENILARSVRRESGTGYKTIDRATYDIYRRTIDDLYNSYDLVMAVATKEYGGNNLRNISNDENSLDFVGLICFSEANVFGVYENIDYLKKSGVSPVMIVDADNSATQRAAKRIGIITSPHEDSGRILDDMKIDRMGDGAFYANVHKFKLFMPVSIQNRVKFLKALRFRKKTSAVTVSDLSELALIEESDISLVPVTAETGALITKASVILQNLSISTISKAIKGAVMIYKNAHNAISFAASMFTVQYLLTFFALIFDGLYLLNAVQMIWSGVAVGYVFAIAMCLSDDTYNWYIYRKKLKDYRQYKKESTKSGILTGVVMFLAVALSFVACIMLEAGALLPAAEYIGSAKGEPAQYILSAQTGAFIALIFACLATALINIKPAHLTDLKILKNKVFTIGVAGNIIFLAAAILIPPFRDFLGFAPLSAKSVLAAIAISFTLPYVYLLIKLRRENRGSKKEKNK